MPSNILVAEDDVIVAHDLRETLTGLGYPVARVVHRGDDAVKAAEHESVDLAILDVRMPGGMDGIDAGRRLNAMGIPVIYVSAYADDETLARASSTGPFGYLVKPFDVRSLRTAVESAAARHEMDRRVRESERRYSTIFQLGPVPILVLAPDLDRVLEANRAFLEHFGYEAGELAGGRLTELSWWPDATTQDRARSSLGRAGGEREIEARVRTSQQEWRDVVLYGERIPLGTGEAVLLLCQDITDRKRFQAELERLALYDQLTGLPNRNLFHDRLHRVLGRVRRHESGVAVLFMDLDRFKVVNDTLGHAAGDELLVQVAARLRTCFRDEDTIARFGGDEFVAVLEEVDSPAEARLAASRLQKALATPFRVRGTPVHLDASIGLAFTRDPDTRGENLLRYGDIAMYGAKDQEGTVVRVFDPGRDADATRRLHLENDLRRGLDEQELVLHYQPIVELPSCRFVGAEALVRWQHPEHGLIAPDRFIPLAEETGLIVRLGRQVFRDACRQRSSWMRRFPAFHRFTLSVNLSPRQVLRTDLAGHVREVLGECELAASGIQFEITEEALVQSSGGTDLLRAAGIRLTIDDFGTGYSSLAYLKLLRVDGLKIDRSFVGGLGRSAEDEAIVRTILLFGRGLGLEVTAEGVETEEQLRLLTEMECPLAQGHWFSRPVPAADFERLLAEGTPSRT